MAETEGKLRSIVAYVTLGVWAVIVTADAFMETVDAPASLPTVVLAIFGYLLAPKVVEAVKTVKKP